MAKKPKRPEIPSLTDDAEYREAVERHNRIKGELADVQRRVQEATSARVTAGERQAERVDAIMEDTSPNGASAPDAEYIGKLRQRRRDLQLAEQLARKKVGAAEYRATARLVEPLRAHREAQMRRLAQAAAALGEVAEDAYMFEREMEAAGLRWSVHLPAVTLKWMRQIRQGDPVSRLNLLIDEIARDYSDAEPERPLRDAAIRDREERARIEAAENEGHTIAAGPDGVRTPWPRGIQPCRIGISEGVRKLAP